MNLERELLEIGAGMEFPATPDLAGSVLAQIRQQPAPRRRWTGIAPARRWTGVAPRVAWVGAAAAVLMAVVLVVPPAREAVADLLGIGRVQVEIVDELPAVGTELALGDEVNLAEARVAVDYPVRVPAALGEPDAVYLAQGGDLFFTYAPRPDLPEVAGSGVGALFGQFPELGSPIVKQASVDTLLVEVFVGGGRGFWIEGGPHVVFFESPGLTTRELAGRLAGNTLIWERDGVTYRLEAALDRAAAIAVAESLR